MYRTFKKILLIGICGGVVLACTWRLVNEAFWDDAAILPTSSTPLPRIK